MMDYHKRVYLDGVDKIAEDTKNLTDAQLEILREKFAEIKELIRLYKIENKPPLQIEKLKLAYKKIWLDQTQSDDKLYRSVDIWDWLENELKTNSQKHL